MSKHVAACACAFRPIVISSPTIASSWCRLWDQALDYGVRGTKLSQSLFRCLGLALKAFVPRLAARGIKERLQLTYKSEPDQPRIFKEEILHIR